MRCSRCPGFMAQDRSYDLFDEAGALHFSAWRCRGCGSMIEEIIAQMKGGTSHSRRLLYAVQT